MTRWNLATTNIVPHDLVDSCVTNHRIVREQRADRSAPPGSLARGRGRPRPGRHRPAARRRGRSVDCTHIKPAGRRAAQTSPAPSRRGVGAGWAWHHQFQGPCASLARYQLPKPPALSASNAAPLDPPLPPLRRGAKAGAGRLQRGIERSLQSREPSGEAGVNAALPDCGTVPMRPCRASEHSLAAASGWMLAGRVF